MNNKTVAYNAGYDAWAERYITCFHEQEKRRIALALGLTSWNDIDRKERPVIAQAWADGNLQSYTDALRKNMASHLTPENGSDIG